MNEVTRIVSLVAALVASSACSMQGTSASLEAQQDAPTESSSSLAGGQGAAAGTASAQSSSGLAAMAHAGIGRPAPDFELPALVGDPVKLSSYRGRIVVLEWFNPGCPFVNQTHSNDRQLRGLGHRLQGPDLAWLAINSAGPGKQGYGRAANERGRAALGIDYPILLDEQGTTGHAYGAERTPHMFVIDRQGSVAYMGALDNTEGGDIEDADSYVNYVVEAIAELRANRPVRTALTRPFGCSVKYGS